MKAIEIRLFRQNAAKIQEAMSDSVSPPRREAAFFNCSGCTVMFLDVARFARLMRRVVNLRGWLEDVPTRPG